MTEDSTWLKKDLTNYPLKRKFKTSLLATVPQQEIDVSIMSNPGKADMPDVFIQRMLERKSRKSRPHQFKVPQLPSTKVIPKKENVKPEMSRKSLMPPGKSFLPVPATRPQPPEINSKKPNLPRPSIMPRTPSQRLNVKRKFMQRMIELSEEKKSTQSKVVSSETSGVRSILKKKQASLRKSQASQSKAGKVLFNVLENSDTEDKENYRTSSPLKTEKEFVVPEPHFSTLLNFSITKNNSQEFKDDTERPEPKLPNNVTASSILEIFNTLKNRMNNLERVHSELEHSLDSILQHTAAAKNECMALNKDFEHFFGTIENLSDELREVIHCRSETTENHRRRSSERKKADKLRLSDKSKAIKGNSKRRGSLPMREILQDLDGMSRLASWKNNG